MSKRHVNIPVFIPHLGCPNQCVFCNQRTISGVKEFSVEDVIPEIESALSTINTVDTDAEIAFFGGSFTGIDYSLMCDLLKIASSYIETGNVSSIRLSTRPDYIDEKILATLKKYGVKTIELGLQSFCDDVLIKSKRGHDSVTAIKACNAIVDAGFELVGQMMIGLPGSTLADEIYTAEQIIKCGAKGARIYPTVVLRETELCDFSTNGTYEPLSLDDAVFRSKEVMKLFIRNNVEVIRIGLHASENLVSPNTYYAGPNHSALGELVYGELYYDVLCEALDGVCFAVGQRIEIRIPLGATSKVVGQKRKNVNRLKEKYKISDIVIAEDASLSEYEIKIN